MKFTNEKHNLINIFKYKSPYKPEEVTPKSRQGGISNTAKHFG